ncbi:hypothetical protein A3A38_03365 [Candidatus Kaiserbacteria bacterium RIFCSPLOWO2_01_FULL_53_17]|uniref:VanZ-like domain-containing protein n=1 Tax=Candidatus Kaiserbacteria bacterium RIFCSPLOWO2_01_FULL_53_17 TaxID=1798511 RepID=A0A1F6EHL2_9BACT|nr:MAG: hypothetical protein A3A38_03365 [Candidatus Kaiserbacteria bacterium RIFCSPLOWO2_01_FULL_53_17]
MREQQLFYTQACLIAFVGAVHIIALDQYLYWRFPWLDLFVHFFAALWIALFAVWFCVVTTRGRAFGKILAVVILAGIGWELFEIWGGIPREANFAFDTALDLTMDTLGGISGFFLASRMLARDTIVPHGTDKNDPS